MVAALRLVEIAGWRHTGFAFHAQGIWGKGSTNSHNATEYIFGRRTFGNWRQRPQL